jgi:hemoglobin
MEESLYDRVGGQEFFDALVERFYGGVEADPVLRPLYPDDLSAPRRHLALFLAQYFGGPSHYNDERGHPRLRMRHAPFVIGGAEHDAWLVHMTQAVGTAGLDAKDEADVLAYFTSAAAMLRNAEQSESPGTTKHSLLPLVPPS